MWEIDDGDVKMRILARRFKGQVKNWFRGSVEGSIVDYLAFEREFLDKWEDKKNLLQLLTQYNNFFKNQFEIVQKFSTRFMKIYQSIPPPYKPPLGAAQLHYADAFENDFSLLLREIKSETLSNMMNDAVEV